MWKLVTMWALTAGVLAAPPQKVSMIGMPESDPEIRKVAEAYRQAVLSGNAGAVAATYDENAVEMPPGRPAVHGRQAIERYYQELFQAPARVTAFALAPGETTVAGGVAYDVGAFRQILAGEGAAPVEMTGSYLVVLKRSKAGWKTAYAIYNMDGPCNTSPSRSEGSAASPHR